MPAVVTEIPYRPVPTEPVRKRWTREECAALEPTRVRDLERIELIDGELITKTPKKPPHSNAVAVLHEWLSEVFGAHYVMQEASIDVAPEDNPTNQPEPDLIVLTRPRREFRNAYPCPADLALAIEISDSTLGFDLTKKAALYARAGIPDCWVLDVQARRLIVHRDPQGGQYRSILIYTEQESVAPLAAPGHEFKVASAF